MGGSEALEFAKNFVLGGTSGCAPSAPRSCSCCTASSRTWSKHHDLNRQGPQQAHAVSDEVAVAATCDSDQGSRKEGFPRAGANCSPDVRHLVAAPGYHLYV